MHVDPFDDEPKHIKRQAYVQASLTASEDEIDTLMGTGAWSQTVSNWHHVRC